MFALIHGPDADPRVPETPTPEPEAPETPAPKRRRSQKTS